MPTASRAVIDAIRVPLTTPVHTPPTTTSAPLITRGEGPSPETVRGEGPLSTASRTMSDIFTNDFTVRARHAETRWHSDPLTQATTEQHQTFSDALRSNSPHVCVDVNPQLAYVEFRYRGENVRVTYPYATVPDMPTLREQAIRHLTPTNNMTATETRMRQEARVSRAADISRMWHDEAANITADAWSRMETGHSRAAATTTTSALTGAMRMEDMERMHQEEGVNAIARAWNRLDANVVANRTTYTPPTDPEAVAKAVGVVEDQTLAALRKLKELGYQWDGKDWVYRYKPT